MTRTYFTGERVPKTGLYRFDKYLPGLSHLESPTEDEATIRLWKGNKFPKVKSTEAPALWLWHGPFFQMQV